MLIDMRHFFEKGQTLIEVVVAFAAAAVVIVAISGAVLSSMNNAQFSKNQNQAFSYAQEGMELMKQLRNANWTLFSSYGTDYYCLDKGGTTLFPKDLAIQGCSHDGSNAQNIDGVYVRQIDIEKNASSCNPIPPTPTPPPPPINATKVTVTVSWSDSQCRNASTIYCHSSQLVSCFTNFTLVPAP